MKINQRIKRDATSVSRQNKTKLRSVSFKCERKDLNLQILQLARLPIDDSFACISLRYFNQISQAIRN